MLCIIISILPNFCYFQGYFLYIPCISFFVSLLLFCTLPCLFSTNFTICFSYFLLVFSSNNFYFIYRLYYRFTRIYLYGGDNVFYWRLVKSGQYSFRLVSLVTFSLLNWKIPAISKESLIDPLSHLLTICPFCTLMFLFYHHQ